MIPSTVVPSIGGIDTETEYFRTVYAHYQRGLWKLILKKKDKEKKKHSHQ